MNRPWARLLALCAMACVSCAANASSISVTTLYDINNPDDDLCSLRESVAASVIAGELNSRKAGLAGVKGGHDLLDKGLVNIQADPDKQTTYPRNEMLAAVVRLADELAKMNQAPVATTDPTLAADVTRLRYKITAIGQRAWPDTVDFREGSGAARYPGSVYYIYGDPGGTLLLADVTVTDPANFPAGPITYSQGDRALWDGVNWTRVAAGQPLPVGAVASSGNQIDFGATLPAQYPAKPLMALGYYTYADLDSSEPQVFDAVLGHLVPAPVGITSPLNFERVEQPDHTFLDVVGGLLNYSPDDRAVWDGTHWTRIDAAAVLPTGVEAADVQTGIDLHIRTEAALQKDIDKLEDLAKRDGCDDGTSFDTAILEENKTYFLNDVLPVNIRMSFRGGDNAVIARCTDAAGCGGVPKNPLPHGLFTIGQSSSVDFNNITLRDGDAGAGDGGAINASGSVTLNDVRLVGNHARDGGAVYVGVSGSAKVNTATFVDNVAARDGGAIFNTANLLDIDEAYFGEWQVDPSAVYYTYGDPAGALVLAPVNVTDDANLPVGPITYSPGDRAVWEGAHWTRVAAGLPLPVGAVAGSVTNVDFGATPPAKYPAKRYTLHGNSAARNGGAIANQIASPTVGTVSATRSAFIGNMAVRGSAVHLGGASSVLLLLNPTLAKNSASDAATIDAQMSFTGSAIIGLNNATVVDNTAANGTAGIATNSVAAMMLSDPADPNSALVADPNHSISVDVKVTNSVVAGNTDLSGGLSPDCDFGIRPPNNYFKHNYFSSGNDCPGLRRSGAPVTPEEENFSLGVNSLGNNVVLKKSPSNLPTDVALLNDMDPATGPYYVPVYPDDVNDSNENRLVNRGADVLENPTCESKDQRNQDRKSAVDDQCDIGSIEYQIGRRHDDKEEMLVDETRCLDVIADDLGDSEYWAGSLRVIDRERGVLAARVVSRVPGNALNVAADPTLNLDVVCPNASKIKHREAILYTPAPGFHGEANVVYAFCWKTTSATEPEKCDPILPPPVYNAADPLWLAFGQSDFGSVNGVVHAITHSRGGVSSSEIGALPAWLLLLLSPLLVLRRAPARIVASLALLFLTGLASADENIIYVNTSLDELSTSTPGDGLCTLREAFDTARNDRANSTGGDCRNGNEGPDVIEFTAGVSTVNLVRTIVSYGNVTLRCPDVNLLSTTVTPAIGCLIQRSQAAGTGRFRLIDSEGSLAVSGITFANALTPDRGAGLDGGAIFSTGSLTIADSTFRNNSAVNGGAIFLAGANSALNIARTVFVNNSSRAGSPDTSPGAAPGALVGTRSGGGGAIATSQSDNHRITIAATSFEGNSSVAGGAAVDLNSRGGAVIANTTFSGNSSVEGAGAIDVSGVQSNVVLRNITVVGNSSGSAQVREPWEPVGAPMQRAAIEYGNATGVSLTSSVVAANVTTADPNVAANCPNRFLYAAYTTQFNLYGDDDNADPTVTPENGFTCTAKKPKLVTDPGFDAQDNNNTLLPADAVIDPASSDAGLLSHLTDVALDNIKLRMHVINVNPVNAPASMLVDAGYNAFAGGASENQVDPTFTATLKCASVDARGASRTSGNRCDIGAFETLALTAKDDGGSNNNRFDRLVIVDILTNDVFDDIPGAAIYKDCDTLDVAANVPISPLPSSGPTTWLRTYTYRNASNGKKCFDIQMPVFTAEETAAGIPVPDIRVLRHDNLADIHIIKSFEPETTMMVNHVDPSDIKGQFPDDYPALGFTRLGKTSRQIDAEIQALARRTELTAAMLKPGYVVVYDSHGVIRDKDHVGTDSFFYRVYTETQNAISAFVPVEVTVDNVPPRSRNDVIYESVGEPITFDVLANDRDFDWVDLRTGVFGVPAFPPTSSVVPANGYYITYQDEDGSDRVGGVDLPVVIGADSYMPGDRAIWDGALWTRLPKGEPFPAAPALEGPTRIAPTLGLKITSISGPGCSANYDKNDPKIVVSWQCQFGEIFLDGATQRLTFVPDNVFNPFLQQFQYTVSDQDAGFKTQKTASATVVISVSRPNGAGGGLLGSKDTGDRLGLNFLGASEYLVFCTLGLAVLRRRVSRPT